MYVQFFISTAPSMNEWRDSSIHTSRSSRYVNQLRPERNSLIYFEIYACKNHWLIFSAYQLTFRLISGNQVLFYEWFGNKLLSKTRNRKTYVGTWCQYAAMISVLTHWGRVTHICVSRLTITGSDNGLSPGRRQAIIWTNVGILVIRTLGTNFSEILGEIHSFSFSKMHLKILSVTWRLFGLGLNELNVRALAFETNSGLFVLWCARQIVERDSSYWCVINLIWPTCR